MKKRGSWHTAAKVSLLRNGRVTEAEEEMLTVQEYERIRRAYYVENKSIRQIEREFRHSYWTVRKALDASGPEPYQLSRPKVVFDSRSLSSMSPSLSVSPGMATVPASMIWKPAST